MEQRQSFGTRSARDGLGALGAVKQVSKTHILLNLRELPTLKECFSLGPWEKLSIKGLCLLGSSCNYSDGDFGITKQISDNIGL